MKSQIQNDQLPVWGLILLILLACGCMRLSAGQAEASQNLAIDPMGRVVDVIFAEDVAINAPWDRFKFGIDIVQPLVRDGGAFFGDLTGDHVDDLV